MTEQNSLNLTNLNLIDILKTSDDILSDEVFPIVEKALEEEVKNLDEIKKSDLKLLEDYFEELENIIEKNKISLESNVRSFYKEKEKNIEKCHLKIKAIEEYLKTTALKGIDDDMKEQMKMLDFQLKYHSKTKYSIQLNSFDDYVFAESKITDADIFINERIIRLSKPFSKILSHKYSTIVIFQDCCLFDLEKNLSVPYPTDVTSCSVSCDLELQVTGDNKEYTISNYCYGSATICLSLTENCLKNFYMTRNYLIHYDENILKFLVINTKEESNCIININGLEMFNGKVVENLVYIPTEKFVLKIDADEKRKEELKVNVETGKFSVRKDLIEKIKGEVFALFTDDLIFLVNPVNDSVISYRMCDFFEEERLMSYRITSDRIIFCFQSLYEEKDITIKEYILSIL